jgi:aspartate/methionine/tyrosine aminotransferase
MERFPSNDIISLVSGDPPLYDLSESYGPHARLRDIVGNDFGEIADLELGYGSAQGDVGVRRLVADLHGVNADSVVLTNGGIQALFLLGYILCGPGDEAVIGSPVFPLARNTFDSVGAKILAVPAVFDDSYRITADAVRARLTPKTRLVSLATPQNPSGIAIPSSTIREIINAMLSACPDAYLIIDETYREAAYGREERAETVVGLSPKIVSVASLSKCHGTPGLRLGWAIAQDAELLNQIIVGKFNTTISCSPLDEAVARRVLGRHNEIMAKTSQILQERLEVTERWVNAEAERIEWVRPDAGAICCVRLKRQRYSDGAVALFYNQLRKQSVRVASGEWFGDEPRVFRLGFGFLRTSDLRSALDRVSPALRAVESQVA